MCLRCTWENDIKKPLQTDILFELIRTAFNMPKITTTMYCEQSTQRYVLKIKQDIREESSLFGQSAV